MPCAPLILASGSPRRRDLLLEMGVEFEVRNARITELDGGSAPDLTPSELALSNARLKARAVARENPEKWVLGADTVVALDGRIFGKPGRPEEAHEFLTAFSGRTHEVITGCVLLGPDGREDSFHDVSRVTFLPLSAEVITRYLDQVDVMDKAGAYALQEKGDWIVASTEGSRTNIIGLPVEKLGELLRAHGLAK